MALSADSQTFNCLLEVVLTQWNTLTRSWIKSINMLVNSCSTYYVTSFNDRRGQVVVSLSCRVCQGNFFTPWTLMASVSMGDSLVRLDP